MSSARLSKRKEGICLHPTVFVDETRVAEYQILQYEKREYEKTWYPEKEAQNTKKIRKTLT